MDEHRGEHGHVPPDPNEGVVRAEPPQRQTLTVATAVGIVTLLVLVAVALAASGG